MMPAPAPLDSVLHYPALGTVRVGTVLVPLRDGRAKRKAKVDKDDKIKIRAVPARPRSVTPAPHQPASQQPSNVPEEMEGTSCDPINVETPVKEVGKPESTEEDMFPDLGPPSPVPTPRPLSIAEGIIADRQVDVVMDEADPDWAGEIARLDRQWENWFRALDEQ